MRILVTGLRAPVALDLARRFRAAGHDVLGADSLALPLGRFSSKIRKFVRLPSPARSAESFGIAVEQLTQDERIELIVPTCEECFYLARHRDRLPCAVLVDHLRTLDMLHDKWTFSQRCGNAWATAPDSLLLRSREDLAPLLPASSDWVFKPVYSRFASRTRVGPSAWRAAQLKPAVHDPWIAQRKVEGRELSTYSVACRGRLLAHVSYTSLYRAGRGSGIHFQALEHRACEQYVRELTNSCQYTGQIGCDFIEAPDGRLWVLEANPRATSGAHLFAPDEPLERALIDAARQAQPAADAPADILRPRAGQAPRMVGPAMPIWGLASALEQHRATRLLGDFWRARDVIFSGSDPLPLLAAPLSLCELIAISWRTGRTLTEASTLDLEWNGQSD